MRVEGCRIEVSWSAALWAGGRIARRRNIQSPATYRWRRELILDAVFERFFREPVQVLLCEGAGHEGKLNSFHFLRRREQRCLILPGRSLRAEAISLGFDWPSQKS